ncbi:hypothetical protein RRG08_030092 [Elysia crispata]|uniref:Uncharacterized protein n=1 Tax=Elysia crispata TaxID=231223 RepID=A0AAE0ZRB0_9GAST|nr:hypothetical protein RRG08_030092 [Elysia crispata]
MVSDQDPSTWECSWPGVERTTSSSTSSFCLSRSDSTGTMTGYSHALQGFREEPGTVIRRPTLADYLLQGYLSSNMASVDDFRWWQARSLHFTFPKTPTSFASPAAARRGNRHGSTGCQNGSENQCAQSFAQAGGTGFQDGWPE